MPRKKREDVIQAQIAELQSELVTIRKNHRWPCPACQKKSRVRDTELIRQYFYISPYSCTGGDYWKIGSYYMVCPKCGHESGGRVKSDYHEGCEDLPFMTSHMSLFKKITERKK